MMHKLHMLAFTILVIGGLNWLAQGLFGWEIGQIFGGQEAALSRIIYILIGASAVYEIATHKGACKRCDMAMMGMKGEGMTQKDGMMKGGGMAGRM